MTNKMNFTLIQKLKLFNLIFSTAFLLLFSRSVLAQYGFSGNKIVSDSLGNSYVAGSFNNSTLSFGSYNLKNFGGSDIFLAKYNSNGKIAWAKNIGGRRDEKLISLSVNGEGVVSLSASSNSGTISIDKSQLLNDGASVVFSAKFNTNGSLLSSNMDKEVLTSNNALRKVTSYDTSLTLISPKTGDDWKVGTKVDVEWNSENVSSIVIELSTDNGATWRKLDTTSQYDFNNEYSLLAPNTPSGSCLIKISSYDDSTIADTSGSFSISGKLLWKAEQSNYNSVLRSVYFVNANTGWAAGYNGLIATNNGGESWSSELDGYGLLDVFFLNENIGWAVGLNGTIFKTANAGYSWTQEKSGYTYNFQKVFFADGNNGYLIGDGSLLKTIDGGESWSVLQTTDHVLQTMFFVNKDTGWVAGNEGVILRTEDGGSTWLSQQNSGTDYGTLTSLCFVNPDTGWASGSGLDISGGVILKTTDGGNSWLLQHSGDNTFVYSVSFSNPDTGWAAGDEGIMFNTTDGGNNWNLQGSETFASLYMVNSFSQSNIWSVGNDGVILKYVDVPFSLPSVTNISKTGIPTGYSLTQNYPNPFNPSTIISYQLAARSQVTLKVYDILGREVATLVNEEKSAGNYEVKFNANNLASGTYIYRFTAGNFVQTKKMLLLK
jgi:photosystem II stability/assembly factor-like uncharacterized protein